MSVALHCVVRYRHDLCTVTCVRCNAPYRAMLCAVQRSMQRCTAQQYCSLTTAILFISQQQYCSFSHATAASKKLVQLRGSQIINPLRSLASHSIPSGDKKHPACEAMLFVRPTLPWLLRGAHGTNFSKFSIPAIIPSSANWRWSADGWRSVPFLVGNKKSLMSCSR